MLPPMISSQTRAIRHLCTDSKVREVGQDLHPPNRQGPVQQINVGKSLTNCCHLFAALVREGDCGDSVALSHKVIVDTPVEQLLLVG